MDISYIITISNETNSFEELFNTITEYKTGNDEIIVLLDSSCTNNEETKKILFKYNNNDTWYYKHDLNKDYSTHKNFALQFCKNPWIFQIDSDECPTVDLLLNIKDIIEVNRGVEAFWIGRLNNFKGVTDKEAIKWGWRLSPSSSIINERVINKNDYEYEFLKKNNFIIKETENKIEYKAVLVNAYDPQCRLFMNKPEIKWFGKLHERITGNKTYVYLPFNEDMALIHTKTIEKQIETNLRYNKLFTETENKGFNLPK